MNINFALNTMNTSKYFAGIMILLLNLGSKFLALEKSRFLLIGTLISITVLIPTMVLFGIWFEVLGIASSFVLATIIQAVYYVIINKKWDGQW